VSPWTPSLSVCVLPKMFDATSRASSPDERACGTQSLFQWEQLAETAGKEVRAHGAGCPRDGLTRHHLGIPAGWTTVASSQ
jgi:hypothetical protein